MKWPRLRGLLPRTLAGRVLLVIVTGLAVAHAASIAFFLYDRERAMDRYAAADIAAHIIERVRPSEGARMPRPRLWWREGGADAVPPAGTRSASSAFASELRRALAEGLGNDPVEWIALSDAALPWRLPARMPPGGGERSATTVLIALELPDGRRATAESLLFRAPMPLPAEAWVSVLLLFVVTATFSIWAVHLAVQPVRMLAEAADRLSRNLAQPPLPEQGAIEIRAAAHAFNRMQDRLRRHIQGRTFAFAAMSHDIRTPLTRLRLRAESLPAQDAARIAEDLAEIEAISTSVIGMARELTSEEPVRRVDLDALARKVADDYAALGATVGVHGTSEPLEARPLALRRALGNLVDNAVKYGGDVSIGLSESNARVLLTVSDRGPGIPAEHIDHVVQPFYRVEGSRNRAHGGAGLGLAIAKDIVEGLGGEMTLENRDGGGLRASIVLPR